MSVEQMREAIKKVYEGIAWKVRCNRMRDSQVIAIYYSFLEKGVFNKRKEKKSKNYQMTLEDFGVKL